MFCSWPFFAQFQVVEEEPHSPGERLVQGLGKLTLTITSPPTPGGFQMWGVPDAKLK